MNKRMIIIIAVCCCFSSISTFAGSAPEESSGNLKKVLPSQTGPQPVFVYGIKIEGEDMRRMDDVESYFQIAADFGVHFIKVIVGQNFYRPHDPLGNWKVPGGLDYDYLAGLAQKYNISIIPDFLSVDQPLDLQTNAGMFADFVFAFVDRYHHTMNIKYTEFQNEPDAENDGGGSVIRMPLSWRGSANDLVRGNNAAYVRIKEKYPDIMVGSAGFLTHTDRHNKLYSAKFYEAYFQAGPKFDFFALHHYPKDHGYVQGNEKGFMPSGYYVFGTFRKLLQRYGYGAKPIFVTEGFEDKPFERDRRVWDWADDDEAAASWLEAYVLTLSKAGETNIMGKIITYARGNSQMALVDRRNNQMRNHYYLVKHCINLFKKYPVYSKHIAGTVNSDSYWVEEFKNSSGYKMWVVFSPFLYETKPDLHMPGIERKTLKDHQQVALTVGGDYGRVKITSVVNNVVKNEEREVINGQIPITLGRMPVFIEGL
jgi:hypothetical protein